MGPPYRISYEIHIISYGYYPEGFAEPASGWHRTFLGSPSMRSRIGSTLVALLAAPAITAPPAGAKQAPPVKFKVATYNIHAGTGRGRGVRPGTDRRGAGGAGRRRHRPAGGRRALGRTQRVRR